MEYLDIVDSNGNPTGEIVERNKAHLEGIMHRTSHVWLLRKKNTSVEVLLQKRSDDKDSFPGCYDISSAGHIPSGVDFAPSAVRELKEELGIDSKEEDLIICGDRIVIWDDSFHGKPFHDRQYSRIFAMWCDKEEKDFTIQKEELSAVMWMEYEELLRSVKEDTIPHCMNLEELSMLRKAFDA